MGHTVLESNIEVLKKLEDQFGKEIFKGSRPTDCELERSNFNIGKRIINRKALGKLVFSNKENISALNKIMWPTIAELQNCGK